MKKIIALALVGAMISSILTGCGSENVQSGVKEEVQVNESFVFSKLSTSEFFSNRDYETSFNDENPTVVELNINSAESQGDGVLIDGTTITIFEEGTYVFSGELLDGQIVVDMKDETHKAQIVLDNVRITNNNEACINVVLADKVFVTTTENSKNYLSSEINDDTSIDGGIFSKCDITLNGEGYLEISVINGDGIVGKDEVTITSGNYNITADAHGIDSNDGVAISNGTFSITSGKDGIHSDHSTNVDKGYVYILDGQFDIISQGDGIDASGFLEINDGTFNIVTNGGWKSAPVKVATANNMGGMGQMTGSMGNIGMMQGGQSLGEMPQGDMGAMQGGQVLGEMPQGDMGAMQGGQVLGEVPQGDMGMMQGGREDFLGDMSEEEIRELMEQVKGMDQAELESLRGQMQSGDRTQGGFTQGTVTDVATEDDNSVSTKGLKTANELRIYGGTFNLDCYDDAIHSDTNLELHGGEFTIGTADDALHANWELHITAGTYIVENCFEGIEGQRITIDGGYIDMYCGDDGINAAGANPDPNDSTISLTINGGTIILDTNFEGDGVDSNGSILITGGNLLISSTTDARDTTLDSQYDSIITGGTFLGTGSSSMTIQNFSEGSTQGSIVITFSAMQNGRITLVDSNGNVIADYDPVKEYQALIISSPELVLGASFTLTAGSYVEEIEMTSLQYGVTGGHSTTGRGNR